jgi:hypothetical protein
VTDAQIPLARPDLGPGEEALVQDVLSSGRLSLGPMLERFERDFPTIREEVRNEQEYLSHFFHARGLLTHWPAEWCPSFKHDCVHWGPASYLRTPRLPAGARVVVFHGTPNPGQAIEGRGRKWYRDIRPTPWIADHWR